MNILLDGIYYHTAWADDDEGTNFSLTEYADAVYIGTYQDESSTDSTDYTDYSWQVIGEDEVEDVENEADLYEDVAVSEVADAVEDADEDAASLRAHVIENDANIQGSQQAQDEGIGNPNELVGTNQGISNWSASSGVTLSEVTGTIYDENEEPIKYMVAEVTSGSGNWISYNADALVSIIANQEDDNVHTLSADFNLSSVVDIPVTLSDGGANTLLDFGSIDNEPTEDTLDNDGVWVYNKSTASVSDEVADIGQVLYFDLSGMSTGDTISIANLKIEAGALATPWRASLDEVRTMAAEAQRLAEGVSDHFWYNNTGAHVTEVTQEEYEQSPSTAGGNVLITAQGMAVRDGETELGSFTSSGIRVGQMGGNGVTIGTSTTSFTGYGGAEVLQIHQGASTPVQTSLVTDYALASGSTYTGTLPSGVMPSSEIIIEHKTLSQGFWWVVSYSVIQGTASTVTITSMTIDYDGASTIEVTNTDTNDCKLTIKYYSGAEASPYFTFGTRKGTAPYSMAIGEGIKLNSTNKGSLGLGKYNWEDNAAIVIGDGTGDYNNQRDDIFRVDWGGGVYSAGGISADGDITSYGDVLVNGTQSVSDLFTDYVIEEGTTSSWQWRQWSGGKIEAWRTISNSAAAGSVWVSPLYYRDLTVSIPSGIFTTAPRVQATSTTSQWWVSYANATSSTSLTYRLVKPVSSSQASGVTLYCWED